MVKEISTKIKKNQSRPKKLSVQQIFALIEINEAPYFRLMIKKANGLSWYGVIANYNPDVALGKYKETKEKIEAAKKALNSYLSVYEGNSALVFSIDMSKRSICQKIGPFLFKNFTDKNKTS